MSTRIKKFMMSIIFWGIIFILCVSCINSHQLTTQEPTHTSTKGPESVASKQPTFTVSVFDSIDPKYLESIKTKSTLTPDMDYSLFRSYQLQLNVDILESVIIKLENYYRKNGVYPDKVSQLVPDYLDEIPLSVLEKEYSYIGPILSSGENNPYLYMIVFDVWSGTDSMGCTASYQRNGENWEMNCYPNK